jgi:hypothetical protein
MAIVLGALDDNIAQGSVQGSQQNGHVAPFIVLGYGLQHLVFSGMQG